MTPGARGTVPTRPAPAPLDPAFLDDVARPPVPPDVLEALVRQTVAAVVADVLSAVQTAPPSES